MNDNQSQQPLSGNQPTAGAARSRERLLSLRIRALSLYSISVFALSALVAGITITHGNERNSWVYSASLDARDPASRPFPNVSSTSDVDDILDNYVVYLQFILAVGNDVDHQAAKGIAAKWNQLKKNDRAAAARFLKGLKFEMDQRMQLTGGSSKRMTSDSPAVRSWVKRYIKDWYREADEHLFRSYATRLAVRNQQIAKAE